MNTVVAVSTGIRLLNKGVYADLIHCVYSTGQGEYDIENWRMVYWRPQKGQLVNPKFGVFCDNWELTKAKYPYLQEQAQGVKDSLASACSYKTTTDWSVDQPFARVCVPVRGNLLWY